LISVLNRLDLCEWRQSAATEHAKITQK